MNNFPNRSSQQHPWNAGSASMNEQQNHGAIGILQQILQAALTSNQLSPAPHHGQPQVQSYGTTTASVLPNQTAAQQNSSVIRDQPQQQLLPPHQASSRNLTAIAMANTASQNAMNQLLAQLQSVTSGGNVGPIGDQNRNPPSSSNAIPLDNSKPAVMASNFTGTALSSSSGQGVPGSVNTNITNQQPQTMPNVTAIHALLQALKQNGPQQQNAVQQPTGTAFQALTQNVSLVHAGNNGNAVQVQSQPIQLSGGQNNVQVQNGSNQNAQPTMNFYHNHGQQPQVQFINNSTSVINQHSTTQQSGIIPQGNGQPQNNSNFLFQLLNNSAALVQNQSNQRLQPNVGNTTFGTTFQPQNNQGYISVQPSNNSNSQVQGQNFPNQVMQSNSNGTHLESSLPMQNRQNTFPLQTLNNTNSHSQGPQVAQPINQTTNLQSIASLLIQNAQPTGRNATASSFRSTSSAQVERVPSQQTSQQTIPVFNSSQKPQCVSSAVVATATAKTMTSNTANKQPSSRSVASGSGQDLLAVNKSTEAHVRGGPKKQHALPPPAKVQTLQAAPCFATGRETRFVPCPAKAMPASHNALNAKLAIPKDAAHGEELICTDAECRNTGIKFLFCHECTKPCPKRNFWKKHGHGRSVNKKTYTKKPPPAEAKVAPSTNTEPPTRPGSITVVTNTSGSQNESTLTTEQTRSLEQIASETMLALGKQKAGHLEKTMLNPFGPGDSLKQAEWESLLEQRPTQDADPLAIEDWLMRVIKVTNTERAIDPSHLQNLAKNWGKPCSPSSTTPPPQQQEQQQQPKPKGGKRSSSKKRAREGTQMHKLESSSASSSITMDDHDETELNVKKRAAV